MDKLYIVMPAYNEEKNIYDVVKSWYPILDLANEDSKIIIADSGSSDSTHSILLDMKSEFSKLDILVDSDKQHGPKLIALYNYAIAQNADYIFQTDSDGQTSPEEFASFWAMRNEYDAIIGNRVVRGDGKIRKFVENVVCFLLRIIFGVKVSDANAPFRLMNCQTLAKYMDRFDPLYNLPNIMLVVFLSYYHEKVMFKEISFKAREKGKNSINIRKIIKIGVKAIGDFRNFKKGL